MIEYILGIITGLILALIALLAGKRFERQINKPVEYFPVLEQRKMAEIIKMMDPIDEILK
jgi:hypothetical protein